MPALRLARLASASLRAPQLAPPRRTPTLVASAPRHIMAAIGGEPMEMPRLSVTRLDETPAAAPPGATVIDVEFAVISAKHAARAKRNWFGKLKHALSMAAWAALIGFLIPPAVVLASLLLRQAG
jgi:hypothetical protein